MESPEYEEKFIHVHAHIHEISCATDSTYMYLNDNGHFESSGWQSTVQSVAHHPLRETGAPAPLDGVYHLRLSLLEQVALKLTWESYMNRLPYMSIKHSFVHYACIWSVHVHMHMHMYMCMYTCTRVHVYNIHVHTVWLPDLPPLVYSGSQG